MTHLVNHSQNLCAEGLNDMAPPQSRCEVEVNCLPGQCTRRHWWVRVLRSGQRVGEVCDQKGKKRKLRAFSSIKMGK